MSGIVFMEVHIGQRQSTMAQAMAQQRVHARRALTFDQRFTSSTPHGFVLLASVRAAEPRFTVRTLVSLISTGSP